MKKSEQKHEPDPPTLENRDGKQAAVAAASPAAATSTEIVAAVVADPSQPVERRSARSTGFVGWLARTAPTVLVLAVLAGLGLWGHHSGWKIPKFSELTGNAKKEQAAWCVEHGVPEADCIACNADLMPKGKLYGWCKEHGVHECVLDHPEIAQLAEVPEISQADLDRAARALALRPRKKNDPSCKLNLRRIQFASLAAVERSGIDIGLVERGPVVEAISVSGEVIYDPTRVAPLASRAPGTVWRVEKDLGDRVVKGDVLALVEAAEVGQAKAELLQALAQLDLRIKTYERLAGLADRVIASSRAFEANTARAEAEVAVKKAIQTLVNLGFQITYEQVRQTPADELEQNVRFLGLPSNITQSFDSSDTTSSLIPIIAPRDGTIVMRDVVASQVIETSKTLFKVADTSRMWLVVYVPLEEAQYISVGQKVVFRADGAQRSEEGKLTWISTDVDKETRVVIVRAELRNSDGRLRNESFGAGEIILRDEQDAIVVPTPAVHWEGCCHVVFVRDKNFMQKDSYKVFHTRSVRPGVTMGERTEMIAGLLPGEVVVTEGSGVLRAELLKGNLGAG